MIYRAKVKPVSVSDPEVQVALDAIRGAIPDLSVFDGARQIDTIALVSGVPKLVPHGLGRKYRGFMVVRRSAAFHILDSGTASDLDKYIHLTSSGGNATVSIVVF